MQMIRSICIGLAVCFVAAAVVSYIVNFDEIEATTATLGALGFGFGVLSIVLTAAIRRRDVR